VCACVCVRVRVRVCLCAADAGLISVESNLFFKPKLKEWSQAFVSSGTLVCPCDIHKLQQPLHLHEALLKHKISHGYLVQWLSTGTDLPLGAVTHRHVTAARP